jgi:homoserine kinase
VTSCVRELDVREFSVRVPASTSNLGSGFDAVGMAIDRWLTVGARIHADDSPVVVAREGTLARLSCAHADDLIWRGFVATCAALGRTPPNGVEIFATSDIPVARGLGSSAAAVVAGVLLANAVLDGDLDHAAIIDVAASLEGHPDNVAPSMLGGAVLSVRTSTGGYRSAPIAVHPSLRFVFLVPDFETRTSVARAVLPAMIPYDVAVNAAGRAAALIMGLQTADAAILAPALDDVLHVPFRRSLIRGYDAVTAAAMDAGAIGATLSGSGSAIVAVARRDVAEKVRNAAQDAWRSAGVSAEAFVTAAELRGATIGETQLYNERLRT